MPGAHRGDDLARAQRQIKFAVAPALGDWLVLARITDIEIGKRQRTTASRTGDVDLRIEDQKRRREIAAERGKTDAPAFRRDMTDRADGLQTMMVGVAPPFALIVEDAACVETQIAADGAHMALGGAGNVGASLRHGGI